VETPPSLIPCGAGFGIRFLARLIDLIYGVFMALLVGVAAGILFAVMAHMGRLAPDWPQLIRQRSFASFGLSLLGTFLYHTVAEGFGSVTIGKLVCGLQVVQADGRPATMKGAFIRDLSYHVDALFFGLVGYQSMKNGPLNQRYGDVWGETVVVKKSIFQPHPPRGPGRMFAGIAMGSILWAGMVFLQMVLKVM
jgi:uncharacterized RDD family membrane protein YckC